MKNHKRAPCPKCLPLGGADYTRESEFKDGVWLRFWECANCGHRRPIGKKPQSKLFNGLTKAQWKTLDELSASTWKSASLGDVTRIEVKNITFSVHPTFVSVTFEYGMKNDEGTMAALLCRNRWHLFVGLKGGVYTPDGKHRGVFDCTLYGKSN